MACTSASEKTETDWMASFRKVRITRQAISPRLAIRTFLNMGELFSGRKRKLVLLLFLRESKGRSSRLRFPQRSIPNQQTNRSRIVSITRVVQLRTVRNQADDIRLGPHFDISTLVRNAVFKGKPAVRSDRDVHEKIYVMSYIPLCVPVGRL